ncbi:D-glycero-beta-D-manno-heptose-1,7-bisphosphate 7-phosphatase [Gammaproteobacteria bacterium]
MATIILDRDGVINYDSSQYIKSPSELVVIPGSLDAIARLYQAGHRIVIATNQSGLARGLFDIETLILIHTKLERQISAIGGRIEAIFFCPHGPEENCNCRKPRPGMYHEIARCLSIRLEGVSCVGDSLRDIQAARAAGGKPVLVLTGNGQATLTNLEKNDDLMVYPDLAHFATAFLTKKFS